MASETVEAMALWFGSTVSSAAYSSQKKLLRRFSPVALGSDDVYSRDLSLREQLREVTEKLITDFTENVM